MANFKLTIADPKYGKTYQTEVKDQSAQIFVGKNIGETVKGEFFDMPGYEFLITGGSDYCGFPMRKGILGIRKKITLLGGVGYRATRSEKGVKRRKTVCGHKINEQIVQINLKVAKEGSKKLADIFGKKEGAEEKKEEAPKEKPEEKPKEEKPKEKPKEEKPEEPPKEKAEEKKQ